MASLGHIAVGFAVARLDAGLARDPDPIAVPRRPGWSAMAFWSGLSMLPDADVIGFVFDVAYADPWGHRGATHSLVFAGALGLALGLAAPVVRRRAFATAILAVAALASHPLLDTLTDGGLGCALLWPFDHTRYFAPWRPIPVAPIGPDFLSVSGLLISMFEIVAFAPVFAYGLRWRWRWPLWPLWAAVVWLLTSGDPIREDLVGYVFDERTEYVAGFSDRAFGAISVGDPEAHVRESFGEPFGEWWVFPRNEWGGCPFVFVEAGAVAALDHLEICAKRGVPVGTSAEDVRRILGPPERVCGRYTRGLEGRPWRHREVCFSKGVVSEKMRQWMR